MPFVLCDDGQLDVTEIGVTPIGQSLWRLNSRLTYHSEKFGKITAHEGFETNLATLYPVGRWNRAAVIHDYLYSKLSELGMTRADADYVFYEALISLGVVPYRAFYMWGAVRILGGLFNRKK